MPWLQSYIPHLCWRVEILFINFLSLEINTKLTNIQIPINVHWVDISGRSLSVTTSFELERKVSQTGPATNLQDPMQNESMCRKTGKITIKSAKYKVFSLFNGLLLGLSWLLFVSYLMTFLSKKRKRKIWTWKWLTWVWVINVLTCILIACCANLKWT